MQQESELDSGHLSHISVFQLGTRKHTKCSKSGADEGLACPGGEQYITEGTLLGLLS